MFMERGLEIGWGGEVDRGYHGEYQWELDETM